MLPLNYRMWPELIRTGQMCTPEGLWRRFQVEDLSRCASLQLFRLLQLHCLLRLSCVVLFTFIFVPLVGRLKLGKNPTQTPPRRCTPGTTSVRPEVISTDLLKASSSLKIPFWTSAVRRWEHRQSSSKSGSITRFRQLQPLFQAHAEEQCCCLVLHCLLSTATG